MKQPLIFISLLLFNFTVLCETPEAMWKSAFQEFDKAEIHFKKAEHSKADSAFSTALAKFLKISVDYPSWETTSVSYRVNECKDKLNEIKNLPSSKNNDAIKKGSDKSDLNKIRAERDKYAKAMIMSYNKNKKYKREMELLKALLSQAQKSAGSNSQTNSDLENAILGKRKLELTIKGLESEISELKIKKATSNEQELIDLQSKMDTFLLDAQKKQRVLEANLNTSQKTLLQKNNTLMDQKRLYKELKALSVESELEKKLYLDQMSEKNTQITKLSKEVNSLKGQKMNMSSSLNLAQKSLVDTENREKASQEKLFKQIESLQGKNIALNARLLKMTQQSSQLSSEKMTQTKLQVDLTKSNNSLTLERKKNAALITEHEKHLLSVKKSQDTLGNQKTELELKVTGLILENKKLLLRASKAQSEKNIVALKNSQLKEQLIDRETSFVNQLKMTSSKQAEVIKKLTKDLKDKSELNNIYAARLDSSSLAMLSLNEKLKKFLKEENSKEGQGDDQEKLNLIKKLEASEGLNKKLNGELISLRERYIKLNKFSGQKDDEIIARYVKLKKVHSELQVDFKKLVQRIPSEGVQESNFTDESSENINRKIETLIYDAYKASNEGKHQVALGLYAQALELDDKNLDALMRTGILYYQLGQLSEAERYLNQAFYQNPDDANILIPLAMSVLDKADYHLGISLLSRAVALKPEDDELRVNLGVALQALGWEKAALREMEKAYEINDKNAQTALNLAVLYLSQTPKRVTQAKAMYEKALTMGAQKSPLLEELLR
ncbi:tetratricopeptide repeat protein [Lentisphaera profundi]|uniref:Tetratricopeptide repeat protein n=1 Tax=Lentisphaera profundi TaxID=1658616 RepID=A0ABY7VS40_9BACT|nr:tetratricopeptide repeat protein [Lentisphaera profundi]WDE97023.1 tetratricopeptide repeat protein [Lentisphaera profundi]